MARVQTAAAEAIYLAAGTFVDNALRRDDSLFTPGSAIWSLAGASDLDARFVQSFTQRPDTTKRKFADKFRDQIGDASPQTIQLAAEILYVYFLIDIDVLGQTKRALIDEVLSWSAEPVSVPAELAATLDGGIASTGTGFNTRRPNYVAYLIEFAKMWKGLAASELEAALADPWRFEGLVHSVEAPGGLGEREALLHLAFPDTFEPIVSLGMKKEIVAGFPQASGDAEGLDRRLAEIRSYLTPEYGETFTFYQDDVAALWRTAAVAPDPGRGPGALSTYLLTWNPKRWLWDTFAEDLATFREQGWFEGTWSCGNTKKIKEGDRVFLLRQAVAPRGIVASGHAIGIPFEGAHWDGDLDHKALYVTVRYDVLLDASRDEVLPISDLTPTIRNAAVWSTQRSGPTIEPSVAEELEKQWAAFLESRLSIAGGRVWWVNQGQTYAEEIAGGYLWAPKANKGRTMKAWTNMERLEAGDIVVHYASKTIRALSRVTQEWQTADRPGELSGEAWEREGYKVLTAYEELREPVPLERLPSTVRMPSKGPFDKNGNVVMHYLFEVPSDMSEALQEFFGPHWPRRELVVHPKQHEKTKGGMQVERHPIYESIADKGFSFPEWLVTDYLLSLGTKPFVLLSGISGTGKTKMAQLVAAYLAPSQSGSVVEPTVLETSPNTFLHTVGLSTLRYGLVVPKDAVGLFPFVDPGSALSCEVSAEGHRSVARLQSAAFTQSDRHLLRLFWRPDTREWLERHTEFGDALLISVAPEEPLRVSLRVEHAARHEVMQASPRVAFISVRADWTDNRSMLGYYNPLTEQYVPTELLRLLLHALAHPDQSHFAILDEMNLAKVEYYFSDFLSAMESGTEIVLHDAGETVTAEVQGRELLIPERVYVPANLLFTGTVNVDETTFMFSPKVLDRANVIQFHTVDLKSYRREGTVAASGDGFALPAAVQLEQLLKTEPARRSDYVQLSGASYGCLETINEILEAHHLHFGYRVANEIARYLGLTEKYLDKKAVPRALDLQIQQKILPKFVGNRAKLERPLWELLLYLQTGTREGLPLTATALDGLEPQAGKFPGSLAALQHMLQTLRQVGFASFIE